MKFGVDFHGVIINPDPLMIRLAKERYGFDLIPENCTASKGAKIMGNRYSELVRLIETTDLLFDLDLAEGLKEAVGSWRADGHKLYVISTLDEMAIGRALEYLKLNKVVFDGGWRRSHCVAPKHVIAREIGIDLLIDDDPRAVQEALDFGVDALLFDRPCNRDADLSLPRFYGWSNRKRYKL